ncbi:MAG: hypothetical protein ACFB4I_06830 [Cyanophyceae cyanobacterium]
MTDTTRDSAIAQAIALMTHYSFETSRNTVQEMVSRWSNQYSVFWIRLAVVEALYLGRYKAVSVEQILSGWRRRGTPVVHFNRDFECVICHNLPRNLANQHFKKTTTVWHRQSHKRKSQYTLRYDSAAPPCPLVNRSAAAVSSPTLSLKERKPAPQPDQVLESLGVAHSSIEQFTPSLEVSEFYWKLKAVASSP